MYLFFAAEPLPLMDLCRRVIRQHITKDRIAAGKIEELNLPKTIKDYLAYKDRARQNTGQHNSHANSLINTNPSATPSPNSAHNLSSNNVAGNVTSQGNNVQSINLNATGNIQAGSNDNSAAGSALQIGENDAGIDSDEDETMTEEPNVPNSTAPQTSVVSS